nr:hypothetical protein BaRGS_010711 [Batillaria attramentaria]
MLQQLYVEERTRSEGDSGIKQIRIRGDGTKPYFTAGFANPNGMAAIHDHTDHVKTVGLGELVAVLNGVEFRTRHNDYKLVRPSTTSGDYHATEDIPYPEVPPEVKNKHNMTERITELREWFKAWRDGNDTVRDYHRYFPSLLCYLEGAWTTDTKNIDEPFDSDRHQIDASSWFDLQEKVRFTSYTGDKSNKQNFAYLPTTIINVTNGEPVFAQWNYRILCHPTKSYVERSELKPVDNLGVRLVRKKSFQEYVHQRGARFEIAYPPTNHDHQVRYSRLDQLMEEIPGKDNYGANITDSVFGLTKYQVKHQASDEDKLLNTAYYHRWFRLTEKGAMGETQAHRGFSDRNLFVAVTKQPRVAPMSVEYNCHTVHHGHGHNEQVCSTSTQRVSYAIPLEIVYLTPLNSWNPYGLEYKGDWHHSNIRANGRNGDHGINHAYNGTDSKAFYQTPAAFFTGGDVDKDPADTARGSAGVLDRHGNVHSVKASGMRVILPYIPGVGTLRTRYPIMPVYAEGSPIWKELEALRDVVLDMKNHLKFFHTPPAAAMTATSHDEADDVEETDVNIPSTFVTSPSDPETAGLHVHTIDLSEWEYKQLTEGNQLLTVLTSEDNGHSHILQIRYDQETGKLRIVSCDKEAECPDGHSAVLEKEEDNIHMV